MDDESPSFVIYHDPPEEEQSTTVSACPPKRAVFAEIKPTSCSHEVNYGSALKYEMLPSPSETLTLSELPPSGLLSEDSKENIFLRSLRALCLKTPPRKVSSSGSKSSATIYRTCTPPPKSKAPSALNHPPEMKQASRVYTIHTPSTCSISPFRI